MLKIYPFLLVILLLSCSSQSQHFDKIKNNDQSLLWKISGKSIKQPIYLLGTMHIIDTSIFTIPDELYNYVKLCPNLALEMNLEEADEIKTNLRELMIIEDTAQTLEKLLSQSDYKLLLKLATDRPIMAIMGKKINRIKPFFVMSFLQIPKGKIAPDEGVDMKLTHFAQKKKINIHGLETFYQEMQSINAIPLAEQVKVLSESIHQADSSEIEWKEMCKMYAQQDLNLLGTKLKAVDLTSAIGTEILTKRNYRFAENAEKLFDQGVFIAVGAGHLIGNEGLINIFREKGYMVQPIDFEFGKKQ